MRNILNHLKKKKPDEFCFFLNLYTYVPSLVNIEHNYFLLSFASYISKVISCIRFYNDFQFFACNQNVLNDIRI